MKLMKKMFLAVALLSSAMMGTAQAATYTVDGNKGESLMVTLFSSVKNSVLSFTGQVVSGVFGDWESDSNDNVILQKLKLSSATESFTVQLKQTGSSNGVFIITPTADSSLSFSNFSSTKGVNSYQVAVVPEPETYALLALGIAGLVLTRRRQNPQAGLTAAA